VADQSLSFRQTDDRLLASQLRERWGRHWLNVVRYSDTAGDASDYPIPRAILYRDYVIDSFNRDKPYDQFLREQIAATFCLRRRNREVEHTVATATWRDPAASASIHCGICI
jgi:hypothetical protein